ncbi:hypothetical protein SRHO_G00011980 [Serrasalmus rhombeus]
MSTTIETPYPYSCNCALDRWAALLLNSAASTLTETVHLQGSVWPHGFITAQLYTMATRLLARRIWSISVKDFRRLPVASLSSSSYSSSLSPSPRPQHFLSCSRSLPLISCRGVSFNVQDHDDFTERVINSELPVVIDFHAQWCGPCKILGPRLEKAIAKQKGRVAMAKVDIDEHTDLAIEYGVSAVPTVIAMRGGDVIDHFVGIKDEDQLDSFVKKLIGQ